MTALLHASRAGHTKAIKLLLEAEGVDIEWQGENGRTALACAALMEREPVVKLLLQARANVNTADETSQTPLSLAAERGFIQIVEALLDAEGVEVNSYDKKKLTPLMRAARRGSVEIVKMLLGTNAVDINAQGDRGRTALSLAARHDKMQVVELLLAESAIKVDITDDE